MRFFLDAQDISSWQKYFVEIIQEIYDNLKITSLRHSKAPFLIR